MGLNEQFRQDPKHFAGLHTLYPYADDVTNAAHMKDLALANGDHFTQVGGENKVAFCDIVPAGAVGGVPGDIMGSYSDDKRLYVMRITYRRASSSSIPVYYLPWQPNHMMRMKLNPSRKHPTTERTWYFRSYTVEPDIFVTAAVSGCSVFVSGEPEQPVVYHINAADVNGPQGQTLETDNDTDYRAAAQAKVAHMTGLHQAAMAQFPKEGAKNPAGGRTLSAQARIGAVHREDYMPEGLPSLLPGLARHRPQRATDFEADQFGTIFGRRKGGTWRFYRQTRTRIAFEKQGQWLFRWVNPVCVRFWP
jgi:hypothetical protein